MAHMDADVLEVPAGKTVIQIFRSICYAFLPSVLKWNSRSRPWPVFTSFGVSILVGALLSEQGLVHV